MSHRRASSPTTWPTGSASSTGGRAHPDVAGGAVARPLVICGQPRTGTTILYDLLAQDPAHRAPLTWEVDYPCPRHDRHLRDRSPDRGVPGHRRHGRAGHPRVHRLPPMGARLAQECVRITASEFRSMIFHTQFGVPAYDRWLLHEADMAPAYRWHRLYLQHLQSEHAGDRWLLKSPAHLWHLGALMAEYPDAVVVQTHRDPFKVIASVSALVAHLRRMASDHGSVAGRRPVRRGHLPGPRPVHGGAARRTLPPEQVVDVQFGAFMADPFATIGAVYDQLGRELTAETESGCGPSWPPIPATGAGGARYSFADTGLDAEALRERAAATRSTSGSPPRGSASELRRARPGHAGTPLGWTVPVATTTNSHPDRPTSRRSRSHPTPSCGRSTRPWPVVPGPLPRRPDGAPAGAWPRIADGGDVLVASPTGTGKTLTGFLVAIDAAYRARPRSGPGGHRHGPGPGVVYVSPLRALAADVHENLQVPLDGIAAEAARLGLPAPDLSVAVRTGDTPAAERAAMRRSPPDLLVTTPESLYLLLTAASSRAMLGGVHTVIVDEVHTWPGTSGEPIWPSASSGWPIWCRPAGGGCSGSASRPPNARSRWSPACCRGRIGARPTTIVDCGHRRDLDVAIELPDSELEAVASGGQLSDVLDRIADHVRQHRTTLVFVNTRKMAERVAHQLAMRLGSADDDRPASGDDRRGRRSTPSTPPCRWPPTTAACRPPAGASSSSGCGPATSGPSWPRPRSSWASTSARWSWCARSARRGPSAPSSSASGGPTTSSRAPRPGGSTR